MLTQERLKELLDYDPETGIFTWKSLPKGRRQNGYRAGYKEYQGYIIISFRPKRIMAHRLAWLYMTGKWPSGDIDHINLIKDDNRFSNLREATRSQNCMNRGVGRISKSGLKGISWLELRKRWRVRVMLNRKQYCRIFKSLDEAIEGAKEMRKTLHGDFACD